MLALRTVLIVFETALLLLSSGCANQTDAQYELKATVPEGGIVSSESLSMDGAYHEGDKVPLSVEVLPGYVFHSWASSNGGSFEDETSPNTTFTMPGADTVVTANFDPDETLYTLTILAGEGGTIPAGLDDSISGQYRAGEDVSIVSRAMPDFAFSEWVSSSGGNFEDAESSSTTFTMPASDTTITAVFTPIA